MRRLLLASPLVLALAACGFNGTDRNQNEEQAGGSASQSAQANIGDELLSQDPSGNAPLDAALADDKPRPVMQAQVVLDRLGFTPGVVDGAMGLSTRNAIKGFQQANDIDESGELDDATKRALAGDDWSAGKWRLHGRGRGFFPQNGNG